MSAPIPTVVLIVEDNKAFSTALREFLALRFPQFEVHEARTGGGALEKFARLQPRLVLMDIQLPDMNGMEIPRRIKAQAPETVVIAMSMMADTRIAEKAQSAGAAAFVGKNHLFRDLEPLIARCIGDFATDGGPINE